MKAIPLTPELYSYIIAHNPDPLPVLEELRRETSALPMARMQISEVQGTFMHLLTKLVGARRIVEVGCFTGYSALCMASALPEGGMLHTLDVNREWTAIARRYFERAGLGARIDLRLSPALDTLPALEREFGASSFDLMFIDADKGNMLAYYEWGLRLLRRGGLVIADNVLWGGSVAEPQAADADTVAIRLFNDVVAKDERVDRALVNVADGLFIARKR